ncbi:MAG: hypothetical protein A3G87_00345 [Omnitrophica bacterium RIFCSPLOWO2_12_FULL_50_11]|nr:MAG: hypothetical protein A3G87_00345 [Omnitrophica bacterium RIFCSPLOWO2_12_FULL_50_11]
MTSPQKHQELLSKSSLIRRHNKFLKKLEAIPERFLGDTQKHVQKDIDRLKKAGVNSLRSLVRLTQRVSNLGGVACWVLAQLKEKRNAKYLLKVLKDGDSKWWMEAGSALATLANRETLKPLLHTFLNGAHTKQRTAAAYALSSLPWDYRLHRGFIEVLKNSEDSPMVRAQVAETLGSLYRFSQRSSRFYTEAVSVLIESLRDKSPEVRFWSAYALGSMRERRALPKLRKLAQSDKAICPGWWAIKDEAKAAIQVIRGGEWPDRKNRCVASAFVKRSL